LGDWRREFPGIAAFTHVVYWQSNLDLVPKQVSNLLVGMVLGAQAAGLFRLAMGMAKVLSTPAMLLRQVLFPDLTRVWTRGEAGFYRILATTAAAAGACGLLLVAVMLSYGAQLLDLLAGAEYAAGAGVMSWLLVAGTLGLCSSVLRAAAYVMGRAANVLRINVAATLVYVAAMMLLTPRLGLVGPGVASCCAALLTLGGMLWLVARHPRMQGVVRA
jgi:O-antigen/teichoic acid export membrane protein